MIREDIIYRIRLLVGFAVLALISAAVAWRLMHP